MIKLSNGHELLFANGSGALAFNGKGWWWEKPLRWLGLLDPKLFSVVAKTVTLEPKKGNLSMWHPWTCVRPVRTVTYLNSNLTYLTAKGEVPAPKTKYTRWGAVNAIGLTNPGIHHWVEHDYPVAKRMGYQIAASVKPENPTEAEVMANILRPLNLAYIEVNVSCPNVHDIPQEVPEILKRLNESKHPVVLKLSNEQACSAIFVKSAEEYVEAFHGINTVPWEKIFKLRRSPISGYKHGLNGGVSGQLISRIALAAVETLRQNTTRPIIGGGGIMNVDDVEYMAMSGAQAYSIGTLFLLAPWEPCRIVDECRANDFV